MWHEARKQEKKIRVMVVDYKRRAERRREFYEKFKADPTQFMQVHGRPCKIHLDPQVTAAADNCMMSWQGDKETMIDRFDVRAHLDIIPEYHSPPEGSIVNPDESSSALGYERYRILIQHELSKVTEDKFLHQIHLEEQYGTAVGPSGRHKAESSKPLAPKAAIGYNYEDSNPTGNTWNSSKSNAAPAEPPVPEEESDEEVDFDLLVNMDDLTLAQKAELNQNGQEFGLGIGEFMNFLNADLEEKEHMRLTKLQEEEKQAMSGRKARRERRAYKDRMILRKGYISPPSYAALDSPAGEVEEKRSSSESRSRSSSPEKIEFITSFGGNESDRDKKEDVKDKFPPNTFGSTFLSGGIARQARKWAKSRSRSPERRKMRSRSKSRDRSSRYRSSRDRKERRRRSSSSSSGAKRSKQKRRSNRRSTSRSRSSSSSRSRSRDRSRRRSHKDRTYSKSQNGRSRSRSRTRSKSRSRNTKRSHRRRSSDRKRKSSRSSSRSSSSSSSRSRSPKRSRRVESKSRNHSSSSRSPSKSRKSKSKERAVISSSSSIVNKLSSQIVTTVATGKNGSEPSSNNHTQIPPKMPSPPLKRYYGRRNEKSESDSISLSESEEEKPKLPEAKESKRSDRNSGTKGKSSVSSSSKINSSHTPSSSSGGSKLKPQERLKKKMQAALNRQLRADKEAEKVRQDKHDQERMEREDTLRELTIKYRRRERERRHKEMDFYPRTRGSSYSSDASSGSRSCASKSKSRSPSPIRSPKRRRARSRSNSPF